MRLPILAALALLASASSVHAESWRAITGTSESATFLEMEGQTKTADGFRGWTVTAWAQTKSPMAGIFGKDIQVERALIEIDCSGGRYRGLQTTYMTKTLTSKGEVEPPSPQWSYIPPGTTGERMQKVFCGAKDQPQLGPPQSSLSAAVSHYFGWLDSQAASK